MQDINGKTLFLQRVTVHVSCNPNIGVIMKKSALSIISLAISAVCASASAQSLTLNDGEISVIPADVTVDGIPVVDIFENGVSTARISLYDNGMEVSKVIDVNLEERVNSCWNEVTDTLYPTKVVPGEPYLRPGYGTVWMPETVILDSIPNPDSLAVAVQSFYGGAKSKYIGWYDSAGRMSCCDYSDSWNFWKYDTYGDRYPYHYWCVIDGQLWDYIQPYGYDYPTDNVAWRRYGETVYDTAYVAVEPLLFMNYDSNSLPAAGGLYLSQNLFNDDSKWEYVVPVMEQYQRIIDQPSENIESPETRMVMHRFGYTADRCIGFNIVSEDGTVIAEIRNGHNAFDVMLESVMQVAGNIYLLMYEDIYDGDGTYSQYQTLYLYDKRDNSVRTVNSVRRQDRFAKAADGKVDINVADDMTDSDVVLSNMAGQTVAGCHLEAGQTETAINAAHLLHGVYNVTVVRQGNVLGSQKLLVK